MGSLWLMGADFPIRPAQGIALPLGEMAARGSRESGPLPRLQYRWSWFCLPDWRSRAVQLLSVPLSTGNAVQPAQTLHMFGSCQNPGAIFQTPEVNVKQCLITKPVIWAFQVGPALLDLQG